VTRTLLFFLLSLAQPQVFWMGRVTAVDKNKIQASSPRQGTLSNMTITLATGARIWKKTTSQDFSAVRVGDEISVRGHRVSQGELVATQVYVNITRITGRITNVNGNEFEVDIFDVSGKRRGETTTVIVDAQTVTGRDVSLSMSDLQKGRYVEIIGLKLPDGKIAATRVDVGQ
jgi:Domain of unknown function (DUF5666)